MSTSDVVAFLPCRRGSERVRAKNTRPFAGVEGGLTAIKVRQLLECSAVDRIVVSTDDPQVKAICEAVSSGGDGRLAVVSRPVSLASSSTSTDELIAHVPRVVEVGLILWTHVTSPFVGPELYAEAVSAYRDSAARGECDSLMSVTRLQNFVWSREGPVNYDRSRERWPRTQTLTPLYEVNSAIFLAPREIYVNHGDRIGARPYLFELPPVSAVDIDWEEDFALAEALWRARGPVRLRPRVP